MKDLGLILLICAVQIAAQQKPEPILVDEMGMPCNEELLARFDNFILRQNETPPASSYIYFYGDDELEGRNLSFAAYLGRGYYRLKDYPDHQFKFERGGNLPKMKIQFWLVPSGADKPAVSPKFETPADGKTTALFDRGFADFNRWYGHLDIYDMGFYDLGCDFPPNVEAFSGRLKQNPNLRGHIIAYTKKGYGSKRGNAVARFAINDIRRRFGISAKRLSFTYGGNRKEPEIELWLVPKGVPLPTNRK